MIPGTPIKNMICPKCGSKHIDGFKHAYWFMCRDCGHNSYPDSDESKAINNFLHGYGGESNDGLRRDDANQE